MAIATGNTFVLKPSERDPSVSNAWPSLPGGRPAGRRVQRRARRQGGRRRDPGPPGCRRGQLRRLDADRPLHPRARERQRQARAGPGGAKNHMVVMPDADLDFTATQRSPRATARPASVHGDLRAVAVGRCGRRPGGAAPGRIREVKVGPGLEPDSEMGPVVTGPRATGSLGYWSPGPTRRPTLVVDGRARSTRTATVSGSAHVLDNVTTDMPAIPTRFRPGAVGPARGQPTTRRSS